MLHTFFSEIGIGVEEWLWLATSLVQLLVLLALPWGLFHLVSLPLQRRERVRLFLDLLETGLNSGKSAEAFLVSASATRDVSLGPHLHLLAAQLETGLRLEEALARVPGLLPPQIVAMLSTGARIGDLRAVLPACRRLLRDGVSQVRGALNYLLLLVAFTLPTAPILVAILNICILPQFEMVARELNGQVGGTFITLRELTRVAIPVCLGLWLVLVAMAVGYIAGPRLKQGRLAPLRPFIDWLGWRLPWKRKRLERDFAGILAVLLDGHVPERVAVESAAACTGNTRFMSAAARTGQQLEQGVPLQTALHQLDPAPELEWRFANARRGRTTLLAALTGWFESLDAAAFQQEQAAAQLFTTGLVLFNGLLVGSAAFAVFSVFLDIIQEGVLW